VQIQFSRREKFRFLGPNQVEMIVSIGFSDLEKAIIAACDLEQLIIVERMPTIFKDFNDNWREIDNNIYLGKFLRGTHAEPVTSRHHAQLFKRDMLLALEHVSRYFNHGASLSSTNLHPENL
jgi:hypothetical protein